MGVTETILLPSLGRQLSNTQRAVSTQSWSICQHCFHYRHNDHNYNSHFYESTNDIHDSSSSNSNSNNNDDHNNTRSTELSHRSCGLATRVAGGKKERMLHQLLDIQRVARGHRGG